MRRQSQPLLAAVVLAAGLSQRMGRENKLLAEYRGKPLLAHTLDLIAASNVAQRIVVTGHDAEAVSRMVPEGFEVAFNDRFNGGMGTSIAAGVRALRPATNGVLIFLGDMPDVQPADVSAVMSVRPVRGSIIIVPCHKDQHGHPVLFGQRHFADLRGLSGDRGARGIIDAHADSVVYVEASAGVLRDIDAPADMTKIQEGD